MKPLIMTVVLVASFGFFFYNIYNLIRLLRLGKKEDNRFDQIGERIKRVFIYVFGQRRLWQNYTFAGIEHFMIFWGFIIISIGTFEIFVSGLFFPETGFKLIPGIGHDYYEYVLDITQALVILALCMGVTNRLTFGKKREVNGPDAVVVLGLIFGLVMTAFLYTGARIALGGAPAEFLPVSSLFAGLFATMSGSSLVFWREFFWWFHVLILLGFLNYLPYSKHSHVFTAALNVFFQNLNPRGALPKIDFENIPEDIDHFGAGKIEDFSWKDLMDSYTCTECGRCTDNCPAWNTEKVLSPRDIVVKLRHNLSSEGQDVVDGKLAAGEGAELASTEWITPDELWACTTCNACVEQCPLFIDQMGKIVDMRRYLTLEGKLTGPAARTLQKLQTHGNPWGFDGADRATWLSGMEGVRVLGKDLESAEPVDVVYWMGCFGAFDPRGQQVSQAVVDLLVKAGVDFAVMGPSETCSGDPARRLGEEALYQELASQNIETMNDLKVKKILTNCPHCFNTIKNEYPQFGGEYEVVHHTDFLLELVKQGKLTPKGEVSERITYHDSCYLGRYNKIYDSPREILKSISGIDLVEMKRSKRDSFCCGAGGGKIWMEEETPRVNWNRFDEAEELKPDTLATACYFCNTMFEDAAKFRGKSEEINIKDVAEILRDSVNKTD
ncbi:heterodisulfide reductase-related iron-sulfur binding cluster [Candidatus Mycalebacterium sp.]